MLCCLNLTEPMEITATFPLANYLTKLRFHYSALILVHGLLALGITIYTKWLARASFIFLFNWYSSIASSHEMRNRILTL